MLVISQLDLMPIPPAPRSGLFFGGKETGRGLSPENHLPGLLPTGSNQEVPVREWRMGDAMSFSSCPSASSSVPGIGCFPSVCPAPSGQCLSVVATVLLGALPPFHAQPVGGRGFLQLLDIVISVTSSHVQFTPLNCGLGP